MCGIIGALLPNAQEDWSLRIKQALSLIHHRGPDSQGKYESNGLYLAHTRLAIHDLSSAGDQPMRNEVSGSILVFNGEIYNYQKLRAALVGHEFKSDSDTEVLLSCLDHFGLEKTLSMIDGMYAFAFWDNKCKRLFIARDRMGEKPLYFSNDPSHFAFASELNALVSLTGIKYDICAEAVNMLLKYGYIPAPLSIYRGISKLLPGNYLTIALENDKLHVQQTEFYRPKVDKNYNMKSSEVPFQFEELLASSLEQRLEADVSVGAFLSGGVDSSLVAAITKSVLGQDIDTFTIGFEEEKYDESGYAADVAKHLGCQHHIQIVNELHMLEIVDELPQIYGEPFADSSQIPTLVLCKQTKESVTVAISGDGGDELFAGYSRYQQVLNRWEKFQRLGTTVRGLSNQASNLIDEYLVKMNFAVPIKEKLRRSLRYAGTKNFKQFYVDNISAQWQCNDGLIDTPIMQISEDNLLRHMMLMDCHQYLPDDILVKVDRASMAHALEVRVPLLANEIVDFSLSLPNHLLVHNGITKWPMRQVLYKHVPESLINRPKKGFAVPIAQWLRGELKSWAESLMTSDQLQMLLPMVDHEQYRLYWRQHQHSAFNWSTQLWNYLQLLNWVKKIHK